MRPKELYHSIRFGIENNLPLMIKGAPGIGKTDIVVKACKDAGADIIIEHPVVSDPTDYKGLPFPDKEGKTAHFLPFGTLQQILVYDDPVEEAKRNKLVYFLDDVGQSSPAVQAATMQLILGRRLNGFKVSDKVVFIAATNRRSDMAGVMGILEPVKSRFAAILELEPYLDDWITWGIQNDMPEHILAFIKFKPEMLTGFKPTADLINTPSPRTIAHAGRIINANPPNDILFELISGAAGQGFATEYTAYTKVYKDLPLYEDIIREPKTTSVPASPDRLIAICTMVAGRTTIKDFGSAMEYVERLPIEYQAMAVIEALERHSHAIQKGSLKYSDHLSEHPAFKPWASKHADMLIL